MRAEQTIRTYLTYLSDPSVLRDEEGIADLRRRAAEATDVVERLRLLSEADRLEQPDAGALEAEFIDVVKTWADAEGVTEGALEQVGVPKPVLAAAGFGPAGRRRKQAARSKAPTKRAPGVGVETVRAAVPVSGTFTTKDLKDASGASPGTVRKAMREMLDDGTIVDRGEDASWSGPGRVPTLYEKA